MVEFFGLICDSVLTVYASTSVVRIVYIPHKEFQKLNRRVWELTHAC